MVKSGFACFVFMVFVLGTLAAQDQRGAEKNYQVVLKYLGTPGWEITDGTTSILINPYLSRINGPGTGRRVGPLPGWRHPPGIWVG
jgi:hypothetical protein